MRSITRRMGYESRADTYRLIVIGDVHLGNLHSDERLLRRLAGEIASEPNTYWLGLGDYLECINIKDPRFDPLELVPWLMGGEQLRNLARAQAARFVEIMKPIADKCIGLCEGNHEWNILARSETDVYSVIIDGLHDPQNEHRLDHAGFVDWVFKRIRDSHTIRIFASHGSQGGRRGGSTALRLEEIAGGLDGVDVVLQGHAHRPQYIPITKRTVARNGVTTRVVHCISIPPMCGDMAYAERKDLPSLPTGWVELWVTPDKRAIEVKTCVGG